MLHQLRYSLATLRFEDWWKHWRRTRHLKPPEYHRDPTRKSGSLVITDWGLDLEQRMTEAVSGVTCETRVIHDPAQGIPHPVEVFVARNPS